MVTVFETCKTKRAACRAGWIMLGGSRTSREEIMAEFDHKMPLCMVLIASLAKAAPVHLQ
jgi:hypothetical protein